MLSAASLLPAAIDKLADAIAATGAFRILRRVDLDGDTRAANEDAETAVGLCVDVETNGLDADRHRIIELAIRRFRYDRKGVITKIDRPFSWLEDPGEPLDPAIVALTKIRDADVAHKAIDEAAATELLRSATIRVAHHAAFDRRFIERRLPGCRGLAWACSLSEIDWTARRFDGSGRSLGWLLSQCGYFLDGAHRAGHDVDALITVLRHTADDGRTALAELLETAAKPGWRIRATGAHFDVKDRLKARGYRWDGEESVWHREVPDEGELGWLAENVYAPGCRARLDAPSIEEVTWLSRHA